MVDVLELLSARSFIERYIIFVAKTTLWIMSVKEYNKRLRIYKALRLSTTALGETAPGKVVNLVANDVNRFDLVSIFINHMWSAPLSAIIIGYFLWVEAKYAGLLGIAAVFIVVPIQCMYFPLISNEAFSVNSATLLPFISKEESITSNLLFFRDRMSELISS